MPEGEDLAPVPHPDDSLPTTLPTTSVVGGVHTFGEADPWLQAAIENKLRDLGPGQGGVNLTVKLSDQRVALVVAHRFSEGWSIAAGGEAFWNGRKPDAFVEVQGSW